MKLPNPERAHIDEGKLIDYCLNPEHEDGKHKARVFKSALGLTRRNAMELRYALLDAVREKDAVTARRYRYGVTYLVDFSMVRDENHCATVRSIWMVRFGEDFARLVTCYVRT